MVKSNIPQQLGWVYISVTESMWGEREGDKANRKNINQTTSGTKFLGERSTRWSQAKNYSNPWWADLTAWLKKFATQGK